MILQTTDINLWTYSSMGLLGIICGIFLTAWHIIIFLIGAYTIIDDNGIPMTMGILALIIITFLMNHFYKDCILTTWESAFMPFISADLIGIWVPFYNFSVESRAVIGSTVILVMILGIIFKLLRYFVIDGVAHAKKMKKIYAESKRRETRRDAAESD